MFPTRAVASCQSSVDRFVAHSSTSCALNPIGISQSVENPNSLLRGRGRGQGGFARACRLRCGSRSIINTHVDRLAAVGRGGARGGSREGKKRHNEVRSCTVAPISAAEVEGSRAVESSSHSPAAFDLDAVHHESAAALISSGEKVAAQDGEWQSFGRDGGVERLSTSSSSTTASSSSNGASGLVAFNNSLGTPTLGTAEFETRQSVELPVDHEGSTAAEEGLGLRDGDISNNGKHGHHPEINNLTDAPEEEDGEDVSVSGQAGLTEEQPPIELHNIKKRSLLDVRKPSLEPPAKTELLPWQVNTAERHNAGPEPQPEPELEEELEYYTPKVGDEVTGVVVSGSEHQLDVEIGAKQLGRMLCKELKPFDVFRADEFFWELDESGTSMPATSFGQFRFLGDRELIRPTYPLVPVGTVLTLAVLGVTLSGRAVLSARKIASRIAWHRVQQIHEQDEPIETQCVAWNSEGLVFKIEGLRAVLPLNEFLDRWTVPKSLKDYVGQWKTVLITDVDEAEKKLLVSEKRAWTWRNLRLGSLVVGTVQRILPFGVELILDGTSLRAMLHISNISRSYIPDIKSVFTPGEKVKAVVINSGNPRRIGVSTADLESRQGLVLQDKQRVFQEAEEMAAKHRSTLFVQETNKLGESTDTRKLIEEPCPANQDWLDFGEISMSDSSQNEE
ncbi:unnamed protein product [Calypogeia fissa]